MARPLPPEESAEMPEPAYPMPTSSPMDMGASMPMDEEAGEGDTAEQGYSCEGKYPLTSPMWTEDVKQGQPRGV